MSSRPPLHILGVNCHMHDSAVCLLRDGRIVAFAEEERFCREKHTSRFPRGAIDYALREAGIGLEAVDHVVYFWRPWAGLVRRGFLTVRARLERGRDPVVRRDRVSILRQMFRVKRQFREIGYRGPFHFADHHRAHIASAFCPSGFDRAAVLVVDANGEAHTTVAATVEGTRIRVLHRIPYPHSLGLLYLCVTEYLGFRENSGEGKVMGLAPYGEPVFLEEFRRILRCGPGFSLKLDMRYFDVHLAKKDYVTPAFVELFGPRRAPEGPIERHHRDVAASLQRHTEEVILHLVRELHRETGLSNLCLAGGVALNSVANGRVLREGPFDRIFVQPAAHDAGTSAGSALLFHHFHLKRPGACFRQTHTAYGPAFSSTEIEAAVRTLLPEGERFEISTPADPPREAARDVARGRIVGWFQGRMEVGPRALGHRSILADPRDPHMKDHLNGRVKHREKFRPFAPAVLASEAGRYFDIEAPSPFMLYVCPVRPEYRATLPAITHVDGSARLQTVTEDSAPELHGVLRWLGKETGVPVVLNTSFNVRGEPIVCTPPDAIRCFLHTGIDVLYLENLRIEKRLPPPGASDD